jgi:hypothetical protein
VTSYKRDAKDVLPGGSDGVVTPTLYYIRAAAMSRYYHTTKPWVDLPSATLLTVSAKMHNSIPGTPGTFFGDPMLGVGLLPTSTDVRAVGAGSVNGVPVTEYEGAYSAASGLAYIKATFGSALSAIVSINQPAYIQFPLASGTYVVPGTS